MKIIKVAGLVSTIAILAAISTGAMAQSAESNAGAASNSNSTSSSGSTSSSTGNNATQNANQGQTFRNRSTTNTGVTLNQTSNAPDRQRSDVNYSGGTYNGSSSWNGGDQTIRTTPTVYAPPVSGGNPCTLAVSGGVSVIGWGAAAGGTFVDADCARRQQAAMMHNAGYAGAAKEMMCDDKSAYYAFRRAGQPCQLRAEWEPAGAPQPQPMVQQAPPPIMAPPPAPMAAKQYQRCNPRAGIVDNCVSG